MPTATEKLEANIAAFRLRRMQRAHETLVCLSHYADPIRPACAGCNNDGLCADIRKVLNK
jgi:hypothetical protein